jgi:polyhydroxyalkanoate synthesis repressor PhaR
MSELRTVRKYSNRRLYDPGEARYVTLSDLGAWVADGVDLRVIDADTKEDITCAVLFRVMAAQESRVNPSMSREFLLQAIRGGTGAASGMIATFLEQSLNLFTLFHANRSKSGDVSHMSPARAALDLAEAHYQRWCAVQSRIIEVVANAEREDLDESGRPAIEGEAAAARRSPRELRP